MGDIVQFLYGGDGLDPTYMEGIFVIKGFVNISWQLDAMHLLNKFNVSQLYVFNNKHSVVRNVY